MIWSVFGLLRTCPFSGQFLPTLFPAVEASDLMALARNKDVELLQAFEGCFDGEFQGEIDYDLFLAQVRVEWVIVLMHGSAFFTPSFLFLVASF